MPMHVEKLEPRRLLSIPTTYPTGAGPANLTLGRDGNLVYSYEPNGDRIPDFSNCGYKGGGVAIPTVAVKTTLTPIVGDNAPQIQAAIDNLAKQSLDANGFRGAILLKAGVYEIGATITIKSQGIILRGEGSGTTGTILRRTVAGSDAITMTGSGSRSKVSGTTHNVTNTYAPVGATWLTLDSVAGLAVGDSIIIHRPDTEAWRTATGQLDHFQPGDADLDWDRVITEIDGNRIRFDAPITESLDAQWGGGTVYEYTWSTRLTNCGVEDLRADCTLGVDELGNTDGAFMKLSSTANCWVRRCYDDKMKGHAMLVSSSKWDTIEDIGSYHNPLTGSHSGASTQIFAGDFSELILWHRITASSGGFEFSGGRQNAGPMAWVECQVPKGFAFSGPHLQWNMGYLWDSLNMAHSLTCIEQHGGEAGGNHVVWNCESTSTYNFECVPTVHQWIIGAQGDALPTVKANLPPDRVISYGTHVQPGSLYRAQLYERRGQQAGLAALGKPDGDNWFDLISSGSGAAMAKAGQTASAQVTLTTSLKYGAQPIKLAISGLPTGATVSYSQQTLTADGQPTINIATKSSTPPGVYKIKVSGVGTFAKNTDAGGTQPVTRSTIVTLTVTPPDAVGVTKIFQAEDLPISATSGDATAVLSETGLSNGKGVQLVGDAAGDFIRFRLSGVSAGKYQVRVGVKMWKPRAIVQVSTGVAGGSLTDTGSPVDLYNTNTVYTELSFGTWQAFSSGDKDFQFTAVGKNPASTGYGIVIDYIKLVPV